MYHWLEKQRGPIKNNNVEAFGGGRIKWQRPLTNKEASKVKSLWRIKCRKERSHSINWEVGKEGSSSIASITKPPTSGVNNAVVRRGGIVWSSMVVNGSCSIIALLFSQQESESSIYL